ncbi:MAG: hypothetical protein FWF47_00015 [Clostridia bacterium]|nr:hypothetical protein [Clostridia bacterium]
MKEKWNPQQNKAPQRLFAHGMLTSQDAAYILDWQIQLPAERIDCALIDECTLLLNPQRETQPTPRKDEIWARIQSALHPVASIPRERPTLLRPRRIAVLVLAAILLLALAAAAVATLLRIDVFNIYTGHVYPQDLPRQTQADALVQHPLVTVSFPHVDVTVCQALYDGHELRILYAMRDRSATERIAAQGEDFEWVMPAAQQDNLCTVGDWIEINGEKDSPHDQLALPGEEPGEMRYFVSLEPRDKTLKDRSSFEVGLPLMWDAECRFKIVPDGMRFTVLTTDINEHTRNAQPLQQIIDGFTFSLEEASFSPISASIVLSISGKSDSALDAISHTWGTAQVYTSAGQPLGVTQVRSWSFREPGKVTVTYRVVPPDIWPDKMLLSIPTDSGTPDAQRTIPITLEAKE